ncbi:MAG: cyclic pyranopterin monophosphate synthase [Candidatus Binatia bacterium]|nr:MAG: cyclic pyranopterin monophosphate synthase [Candidatus Binatia bacterium]
MPLDRFGRNIDYLRVSIIDHCNLRCVYCMPLQGLRLTRPDELLSAAEIERVVHAAAQIGFAKVRLTGGEPTLRPDLEDIVQRIASIRGIHDLSMTTNGILLPKMAERLRQAGLKRVNIHVDSLHPGRLQRIMRFGTLEEIWAGIEAAERAGLCPIKLNVVVARGYNDEDVVDLARLTLIHPWHVRFIELMPLGGGEESRIAVSHFVSNENVLRQIQENLGPLEPVSALHPSDEAVYYRIPGAQGLVGLISPVSRPYCGTCNRMRLTADGKLHLCLLHDEEIDVRDILRNGGSTETLAELLALAVRRKPTGHALSAGISPEERSMYQIGG